MSDGTDDIEDETYLTGDAPGRTIEGGIFPFSARANAREAIFSDVLAAILGSDPTLTVEEDLHERILTGDFETLDIDSEVSRETIWDVYTEKYTAKTQGENLVAVPFHPEIPKRIKPEFSNRWGTWYRLHLSHFNDGSLSFNQSLHDQFVDRLEGLEASNIFENAIIQIVQSFESDSDTSPQRELTPLRPYMGEAVSNFETDLRAWLQNDVGSSSDWLRGCQDLIGVYFFMYYVQVAVNLRNEWQQFTDDGSSTPYEPRVVSIPFGVESERASLDRPFVQVWEGERGIEYSIQKDIYLSWGRLAVTRILNKALEAENQAPDHPLTLTEATTAMDESARSTAIEMLREPLSEESNGAEESRVTENGTENEIDEQEASTEDDSDDDTGGVDTDRTDDESTDGQEQTPDQSSGGEPEAGGASRDELVEAARELVTAVDNYYRYQAIDPTPVSMGVRGVMNLATAESRYLAERRGRPGFRFQMADETLAFLARVFALDEERDRENRGFDDFIRYLKRRGFDLDSRSQTAARETLQNMGLLDQESDSGESVNVRAY